MNAGSHPPRLILQKEVLKMLSFNQSIPYSKKTVSNNSFNSVKRIDYNQTHHFLQSLLQLYDEDEKLIIIEAKQKPYKWTLYNGNRLSLNPTANIYYTVNPRFRLSTNSAGYITGHGSKEDIKHAIAFYADLDVGHEGHKKTSYYQSKEDAITALKAFILPPTFIIDSGHGIQALWLLKEPLTIGEDIELEEYEAINRGLQERLHADTTSDISRILRLPGSINNKNPAKPEPVKIIEESNKYYNLDDFDVIMPVYQVEDRKLELNMNFNVAGDVDLSRLSNRIQKIILEQVDPENPQNNDRSELIQSVVTAMVKENYNDDEIYTVLTTPNYRISEKILTEKKTETARKRYVALSIAKAREFLKKNIKIFAGAVTKKGSTTRVDKERIIRNLLLSKALENVYYDVNEDSFYQWTGSYYKAMRKDIEMKQLLQNYAMRENIILPDRHMSEIVNTLKTLPQLNELPKEKPIIPVLNGVLTFERKQGDIIEWKLEPHSPDNGNKYVLNVVYDPNAEAPTWEAFIKSLELPQAQELLLQEYLGYMLLPANALNLEKMLILWGEGANGKGVITRTLTNHIFKGVTSTLRIDEMHGFKLSQIIGKIVNIGSEITAEGKYIDTQIVKQLISGDDITIDIKYKHPISYKPNIKLLFAVNSLPTTRDTSSGFTRRLLIIYFHKQFLDNGDPTLEEKIAKEIPGVLNWMLKGLERVITQQGFTDEESKKLVAHYYESNNPVYSFLKEKTTVIDSAFTPRSALYTEYRNWCVTSGYKALGKSNFYEEVRKIIRIVEDFKTVEEIQRKVDGQGTRGFLNLEIID